MPTCSHCAAAPPPLLHSVDICMCVWGDSAVLYYICHPSFHLSQVLPWLLQTHCCLFFEKDSGKRWERVIKSNITMRCSFTLTGSFSLIFHKKKFCVVDEEFKLYPECVWCSVFQWISQRDQTDRTNRLWARLKTSEMLWRATIKSYKWKILDSDHRIRTGESNMNDLHLTLDVWAYGEKLAALVARILPIYIHIHTHVLEYYGKRILVSLVAVFRCL